MATDHKLTRAEKTCEALELKKKGWTYRAIGEELGIGASTVHKYIKAELAKLADTNKDLTEQFRALQLARYEKLLVLAFEEVEAGNLAGVERARRVLDSINDLTGVKAPQKIAPTDPSGEKQYNPDDMTPDERRKRIEELLRKQSGD